MRDKFNDEFSEQDIELFWDQFHFTSVFGGQRRKKLKTKFQSYSNSSLKLTDFQLDLVSIPAKLLNQGYKVYILFCIDVIRW